MNIGGVCGKFTTAEAGSSGDGNEEKNKMDVPDEKKNATTKKSQEIFALAFGFIFLKSGTHFTGS